MKLYSTRNEIVHSPLTVEYELTPPKALGTHLARHTKNGGRKKIDADTYLKHAGDVEAALAGLEEIYEGLLRVHDSVSQVKIYRVQWRAKGQNG